MALTKGRLRELRREQLRQIQPPSQRLLSDTDDVVDDPSSPVGQTGSSARAPLALGVSWVVVIALATAVEPPPVTPDAGQPLWASVWTIALLAALTATGVGLARRPRAGFSDSAVAAGVALFGAVMCPVSGHHAVGAWWFAQMAGFMALGAASLLGLRSFRARP